MACARLQSSPLFYSMRVTNGFQVDFIGVDIFFVISGYLISSIILDEMSREKFSFIKFYERRIRRILPALFAVLLVTIIVGYFFLLPKEYMTLVQSTLAAAAFFPNIYFWETSSTYFGLDIVTTPLLHTWSLGVEEQFYIVFPAILYVLISRCQRKIVCFSHSDITCFVIDR